MNMEVAKLMLYEICVQLGYLLPKTKETDDQLSCTGKIEQKNEVEFVLLNTEILIYQLEELFNIKSGGGRIYLFGADTLKL